MILRYISQGLLVISITSVVLVAMALIGLRFFGGQLLTVQSNSMDPIFSRYDAVVVWPIAREALRPGQIVSYPSPTGNGVIVSHRITAIDSHLQTVTTAGDAQQGKDLPMPVTGVSGHVVGVIPGFGRALTAIRNPVVLLGLVYLPATIFAYRELQRVQAHFSRPRYRAIQRGMIH